MRLFRKDSNVSIRLTGLLDDKQEIDQHRSSIDWSVAAKSGSKPKYIAEPIEWFLPRQKEVQQIPHLASFVTNVRHSSLHEFIDQIPSYCMRTGIFKKENRRQYVVKWIAAGNSNETSDIPFCSTRRLGGYFKARGATSLWKDHQIIQRFRWQSIGGFRFQHLPSIHCILPGFPQFQLLNLDFVLNTAVRIRLRKSETVNELAILPFLLRSFVNRCFVLSVVNHVTVARDWRQIRLVDLTIAEVLNKNVDCCCVLCWCGCRNRLVLTQFYTEFHDLLFFI